MLVFLLLSPVIAFGGSTGPSYLNAETDNSSFQLFYYWDLRDRDSSFQVFNTSGDPVSIHVQIFIANSTPGDCNEIDFIDELTALDAHIYELQNLARNDGTLPPLSFTLPDNTFGFAVISVIESPGFEVVNNPVLIGSFRIVDNAGYEYRANPAGVKPIGFTTDSYSFNFDSLGDVTSSDVVGIPIVWGGSGFSAVMAGPQIFALFDPLILDEHENVTSCSPVIFTCSAAGLNQGINNVLRNTKNGTRICNSSQNRGLMKFTPPLTTDGLPPDFIQAEFFVGFIGLNDGGKIGSMDSFIASP
jgi:hypothetical protein